MGYHTIGRFAMGRRAFGFPSGFAVNVGKDEPGPQRIRACKPGLGIVTACGILVLCVERPSQYRDSWVRGHYSLAERCEI